MTFLSHFIVPVSIIGVVGILILAILSDRHEKKVKVRQKALSEATNALRSLAHIADSAEHRAKTGSEALEAKQRAYYYGRAASIVASIPVDRL